MLIADMNQIRLKGGYLNNKDNWDTCTCSTQISLTETARQGQTSHSWHQYNKFIDMTTKIVQIRVAKIVLFCDNCV